MEKRFDLSCPMSDTSDLSEREKEFLNFAVRLEHGTPTFKIRHFVGDAQITAYAKYKQIMLELRSREELIETMIMNVSKLKAEASLIEKQYEFADEDARSVLEWDIKIKQNEVVKTERRLALAYDERRKYLTVLHEMYANGEAYLEDGTDMKDACLDPVRSEDLERQHWIHRLGKQAAMDMISYGHIGTGNLEAISMMDESTAVETLRLAITFSHGVKSALGSIEQGVLKAITDGSVTTTLKIEKQSTQAELEG